MGKSTAAYKYVRAARAKRATHIAALLVKRLAVLPHEANVRNKGLQLDVPFRLAAPLRIVHATLQLRLNSAEIHGGLHGVKVRRERVQVDGLQKETRVVVVHEALEQVVAAPPHVEIRRRLRALLRASALRALRALRASR